MLRAGARVLLCICGLSSLVACVAPRSHDEPSAQHTRADCSGCHEREYRNAPHHVDAKPTRCAVCHTETSWQPTQLTHAWTLTGAHAKTDCAACHKGWSPQYEHTDKTCSGCHREAFEKADVPSHQHALVDSNCQQCHTSQAWQPARQPRAKPAQPAALQLSAATQAPAAPGPAQRAGGAPAAPAEPVARATAEPTQPASVVLAAGSQPATTATLAKAPTRVRRGELKKRRARSTAPTLPNNAASASEPPASEARVNAAKQTSPSPTAARLQKPLGATELPATEVQSAAAAKQANASLQPPRAARVQKAPAATEPPATEAKGAVAKQANVSLLPPAAARPQKAPADPALRQPLAATNRSNLTATTLAGSQPATPASQPGALSKPRLPSGQPTRLGQQPANARTKAPDAAASK